ncbi:MAG: DEAD/DEAH box helicase [Chitinophagales bacterium]
MKFQDYKISDTLKQNLESMGIKRPTDIQFKCIPPILKGEDVLAIAQTGTGKTLAFALPLIDTIHKSKKNKAASDIQAVVLVPTRELALQITSVFNQLEKHTRCKSLCIFGGVEQDKQIKSLLKGNDILIATPGRLFDLNAQGYVSLKNTKTLVLDEADHMLDLGFIDDIRDLSARLPAKRQTLFFSATINPKIKKLAYSLISKNAIRIQISPDNPVNKNVSHALCFIGIDDKRFFLERFINENPESKILVFVRTRVRAERVKNAMERVNIACETLHGAKDQKERIKILDAFKENEINVLIATDVSARGIDVSNVEFVINYDMPEKAENYVHRIGRTGRGNKKGQALSFCSTEEKELLKEIEELLGKKIKVLPVHKKDYEDTIALSDQMQEDSGDNWKALIEDEMNNKRKKRK